MTRSYGRLLLGLLLGVTALLLYGTLNNGHSWAGDFAAYVMQAESILKGTSASYVAENSFAMEQSSSRIGPDAYPWGYPALLAPVYAVFGLNMIALKSIGILSFLLFLLVLWTGFRRYHSSLWLLCLVAIFALNPTFLEFSNTVYSDMAFLLFSTSSVVLMGAVVVDDHRLTASRLRDNILLGAAITCAYLIRPNGILLLLTLGVTQLVALGRSPEPGTQTGSTSIRDRPSVGALSGRTPWVSLTPFAFFLSVVIAQHVVLPGDASHVSLLDRVSSGSLLSNLRYYVHLSAQFFPGGLFSGSDARLIYGATLPISIVGVIRRYRVDYHIITYVLLTVLLYIVWPGRQGLRFIFPILPFYFSFVITGLATFQGGATRAERALRSVAVLVPVLLVLSSFAAGSLRAASDNMARGRGTSDGPFTSASGELFAFIAQNTEPESTIIFFKPRIMTLMTGRRSLTLSDLDDLWRGSYVGLYLREGTPYQVAPEVVTALSREGRARLLYENSDFRFYRLTGSRGAPRADAPAPVERLFERNPVEATR
jgi:hypothetical protein